MLNNVFRQSAAYEFESEGKRADQEESDDDFIRVDFKGLCKPTRLLPLTQACLKA